MMTGSIRMPICIGLRIPPVLHQSKKLKIFQTPASLQILSDSDDCSTGTPGPMVEDTHTFFR